MTEIPDLYVDQFLLGAGPYGISLTFGRSSPKPPSPGATPQGEEVAVIRMSLEHFKLMAFLMKRQVLDIEYQLGINIPMPLQLMNQLRIGPEDWEKYWQREK